MVVTFVSIDDLRTHCNFAVRHRFTAMLNLTAYVNGWAVGEIVPGQGRHAASEKIGMHEPRWLWVEIALGGQFEILQHLMQREGQVVPRDSLVSDLWKETARSSTLDNVIDVHIARLRRKIDLDQPVRLIHTIRGVGFMLREGEP